MTEMPPGKHPGPLNTTHFGVVMVVNLAIGTIHPPVGNCLYIVSAISGESM